MLRYHVVKDNTSIEMVNYVFNFSYNHLKLPLQICFAYRFKVGTFPCKMRPASPLHAKQFPSTSINPENGQKRFFSAEGWIVLNVARASLWTTVSTLGQSFLYSMVFTACRHDSPLPSNQAGIGAMLVQFFYPANFPACNVKPMMYVITWQREPIDRRRP